MGRKHLCNNGEAARVFASTAAASDIICLLYAIAKINRHIALLSKSHKLNIPKQSKEYQITAVFVLLPVTLSKLKEQYKGAIVIRK